MKFSFVSPIYNAENWLENLLNSIPKEFDSEIIAVDDCSTDNSLNILKSYQKHCNKLKIFRNDVNKGNVYSYNKCLDLATGDYIIIIDCDDMFLPPIRDVLNLVDGSYDIYYYNFLNKDGSIFVKNLDNRYSLSANFKVMRRSHIGNTRYYGGACADWNFNKDLMLKNGSEYYTGLFAYWYNYPREGSLYDRVQKGEIPW